MPILWGSCPKCGKKRWVQSKDQICRKCTNAEKKSGVLK